MMNQRDEESMSLPWLSALFRFGTYVATLVGSVFLSAAALAYIIFSRFVIVGVLLIILQFIGALISLGLARRRVSRTGERPRVGIALAIGLPASLAAVILGLLFIAGGFE